MKSEAIREALALAGRTGHLLVATAGANGLPHLAAAGTVALRPDGRLEITEWFCPGTMSNLAANRRLALVAWDAATDRGYQLLGESEGVEDVAILDGWGPEPPGAVPIPQVERKIIMRVDRIIDFSRAPHGDREET